MSFCSFDERGGGFLLLLVLLAMSAKPLFNIFDFVHRPLQLYTEVSRFRNPRIEYQISYPCSLGIVKMQIAQKMIDLRSINRGLFGILSAVAYLNCGFINRVEVFVFVRDGRMTYFA